MIKLRHIFSLLATATLMVACSSDSDLPVTHPDGYGELGFSIGSGVLTRADIKYVPYDFDRDPHTMGVWGWHDLSTANFSNEACKMFDNQEVTASMETLNDKDTVMWSYNPKKYWFNYAEYNKFDFIGYMPHSENTTLTTTENDNEYKLTMPVSFPDGAVFSPVETALMCAAPVHLTVADGRVSFLMDQTLTAYTLVFELGEKMDSLRDFIIKDVKLYGESLAYSGTVSRTYTWSNTGNSWTVGNITWSDVLSKDVAYEDRISVPYRNNGGDTLSKYYIDPVKAGENTPAKPGMLRVTKTPVQWGTPIYVIPNSTFAPVFEVTYDAVVTNENKDDVVTRKDIKSTIAFTEDIFGTFTQGKMGSTHPIRIKIVPDHLYVLADADQYFGYLPLGN